MKKRTGSILLSAMVCLLMGSFLLTPVSVFANSTNSTLKQLDVMQDSINVIYGMLPSLGVSAMSQMQPTLLLLERIQSELFLMQVLNTAPGIIAEVVVTQTPPSAEAQVITPNGVQTLNFYFSNSFSGASEEVLVKETIKRMSTTLNISESILKSGTVVVTAFSGLSIPASLIQNMPPLSVQQLILRLQNIRTNILDIKVTGDISTFKAKAEVSYGQDVDNAGNILPPVMKTYNYSYQPSTTTLSKQAMVTELNVNVIRSLYDDLRVPYKDISDKLRMSFKKFNSAAEVRNFFNSQYKFLSFLNFVGQYSIIEDIFISVGDEKGFSIVVKTDQNELVEFSILRHGLNSYGYTTSNNYDSKTSLTINGVLAGTTGSSNISYSDVLTSALRDLEGLGVEFSVSDNTIISELVNFGLNNGSYYDDSGSLRSPSSYTPALLAAPARCLRSTKNKTIINKVVEFATQNVSLDDSVSNVVTLYPMLIDSNYYNMNSWYNYYSSCYEDRTNFFRSQ